jgi:hypothetical protein
MVADRRFSQMVSHPGSEKWNRSIRTCAQDVQITHTMNNMINRWNVLIKQSNISYIMTRGSEKDYIKAAPILSIVWAFIGADRWRGPPSAPFLDHAETPGSNLQFHLNQLCRQIWVDLWLLLSKCGKNMTCRLTTRTAKLGFDLQEAVVNIYTLMLLFTRRTSSSNWTSQQRTSSSNWITWQWISSSN